MNAVPFIEKARAKINLTLHVGPPSADGYHPLQSLVVFADIGDVLELRPSENKQSTLMIDGPFAQGLETDASNLVLQTANLMSPKKFDFILTKSLPIASGIGGGSADAAASARLVSKAAGLDVDQYDHPLLDLGADIPVCLKSETCWMTGKGEHLTPLAGLGYLHAVLINPGVAVSTGKVFDLFDQTEPDDRNLSDRLPDDSGLLEIALAGRNDLQAVAKSLAPEIGIVLKVLELQEGCQLARMSGSGATCFGLFPSVEMSRKAQKQICEQYPDWWCVQTVLGEAI